MGNHPSTAREGGGPSSRQLPPPPPPPPPPPQHHAPDPAAPRSSSARAPLGVNTLRAVAPAQASLAQARGSTDITNSAALPITSLAASPGGALNPRAPDSRAVPARAAAEAAPSKPVDVPHPHNAAAAAAAAAAAGLPPGALTPDAGEPGLPSHGSVSNMSFTSRPPRLPLPIDEEVHTPGSPLIAPADLVEPAVPDDLVGLAGDDEAALLPRKASTLSSASTIDEDDAEELRVDKNRPTVLTTLLWTRGGDKVYVTGTIFQWNRKQRLHAVEGRPGVFAAKIHIYPGTHHIRFLVDNEMQTSPDLPTTVDFGNNLVNYIEVSSDDVPVTATPSPAAAPADARPLVDKQPAYKQLPPREAFSAAVPQYLDDLDADETTPGGPERAETAMAAIDTLDTPPSLPGFLAKPILNAATLMKDDNSVLNMPNHTTLNHLATSSIKQGTLAVSATTRYRDKYVTTIMYKPVVA